MDVAQVFLMLIGFGSILFLSYITTRYIGTKANKTMMGKNVSVVESVSLGMDKKLHLVKAGGQFLLIASTSKSVEFISEIKLDEAAETEGNQSISGLQNVFDFKSIFEKYTGMYKNIKGNMAGTAVKDINESRLKRDNFRNNLEKLRNITGNTVKQDLKNEDEYTNEK